MEIYQQSLTFGAYCCYSSVVILKQNAIRLTEVIVINKLKIFLVKLKHWKSFGTKHLLCALNANNESVIYSCMQ